MAGDWNGSIPNPRHRRGIPKMIDVASEHFRDEYLTIADLSQRIGYSPQSIRNMMSRGVFRLGVHYVKPRRRVLFKWSKIVAWLHGESAAIDIPLTRGP
jgi:hypothetical protein